MKMILLSLLVFSCTNLRVTPSSINTSNNIGQLVESSGEPKHCEKLMSYKYCIWDQDIFVFKNEKYLETIKITPSEMNFKVLVLAYAKQSPKGKKIFIQSSKENLKWEQYSPMLKASLLANGIVVVDSKEASDQTLTVEYGAKGSKVKTVFKSWGEKKGRKKEIENTHILTLKAFDSRLLSAQTKPKETWKLKITSASPTTELSKVMPALITAALPYLLVEENSSVKGVMNENSLHMLALTHFSKQ